MHPESSFKNTVIKLLLVPVLFVYACAFAGGFGAIHNQISYTVSPEYFTKFKFHQFGIDETYPERVGAAIVGWNASWWMGMVIGIILIPLGLLMPAKQYFWSMIRVFWIVVLTTLCIGLSALSVAFFVVDPTTVVDFTRYNHEITNDAAFARAGAMHNFSYLGGLIGIITGSIAIFWFRKSNQSSALKEAPTIHR